MIHYFVESVPSAAKAAITEASKAPADSFRSPDCGDEKAALALYAGIAAMDEELRVALFGDVTWQLHICYNDEPPETRKPCEIVPLK